MEINKQEKEILLKDGIIIDPFRNKTFKGDILIKNGKIDSVGEVNAGSSTRVIDCTRLVVTHGFCDLHAHFREPGREDKETLETGSRAALAGGFTRVCVMPNTNPPLDSPEAIRFIIEKAAELPIHIHPIGAVTKGQKGKELSEMGAMKNEGAVAFSDDGFPIANGNIMRLALEYARMFDNPVINHAEDPFLRNNGVMNEGLVSTRLGLTGNPDVAESAMVNRDLELTVMTGSSLHVPHVSTAQAVKRIREFKLRSEKITGEVTPHHLYFNDEALSSYNTNLKVAPPIRNEANRQALIEAIKDGTFDCIATDHAPHTIEEKEATFDEAPFGMIGLESCFGAVNKVLAEESDLPLEDIIIKLTVNPRKIMGFESDLLASGREAELVVIDPNEEWTFNFNDIYSRSKNSPFVGEKLVGRIRFTLSRGFISKMK